MKNAFRNIVSHDKLRGLLTRKKVTSLLILTAVVAALFVTSTVSFARSNLSNGSSQSYIATLTKYSHRSSKPTVPLTAIRMLDKTHGWALTGTSVLKTSDGGLHWTDVTAPNSPVHPGAGTFVNQNIAWVVGATVSTTGQGLFTVQHTSDGGIHWQSSQFSDGNESTSGIIDPPHFLNAQEGWLDVQRNSTMGTGTTTNDVFHTTDGGSHWSKLATDEQIHQNASVYGRGTGISLKDGQNIWDTVDAVPSPATGAIPTNPIAYVTHNGGKTWQQQTLPSIPGLASTRYATTPPVFFGNDGLMPVTTSGNSALSIYVTNDGGIDWSSSAQTTFQASQEYILDRQHIWVASIDGSMHESQDGGKSWNTLGSIGKPFTPAAAMSFTDTNNGWVITVADAQGNGSQLLHTTDGGRTWQPINYSIQ